jgi:Sugar-binding cellulase-like
MESSRREFIRTISLATALITVPGMTKNLDRSPVTVGESDRLRVSKIRKPVAIAMWDYSWILRHHRYGEFENWKIVLEELAERGYNAIRIDAMPQFVAADSSGKTETEFRSVKDGWKPSLWGNDYTMSFRPREALLEFLPECRRQGIKVGLATWFLRHGTLRSDIFMEEGGLMRAWDETLTFLKSNDLLENVIYVDLLNEYPNWHGYDWLLNKLKALSGAGQNENPEKQKFYNDFINNLAGSLKSKYPGLDFFASLDSGMDLDLIDLSHFNALDYHIWFAHTNKIPGLTEVSSLNQTLDLRKIYAGLTDYWKENKKEMTEWMDGRLNTISATASKHNIVCGNTEGWGPIFWYDHPELDWKWVKECSEICVGLARKHENYKFICTSNFTHPQFKGMWKDKKWHQKITSSIKA